LEPGGGRRGVCFVRGSLRDSSARAGVARGQGWGSVARCGWMLENPPGDAFQRCERRPGSLVRAANGARLSAAARDSVVWAQRCLPERQTRPVQPWGPRASPHVPCHAGAALVHHRVRRSAVVAPWPFLPRSTEVGKHPFNDKQSQIAERNTKLNFLQSIQI
jgi:hypothetical protein